MNSYKQPSLSAQLIVVNRVRGLLDRKIQEERPEVFPKIVEKIYSGSDEASTRWADWNIRYSPSYSHVPLPSDFPRSADPLSGKIVASMRTGRVRLQTVLDRAATVKNALLGAVSSLKDINDLILNNDIAHAAEKIISHVNEYGHSHVILRKVAFLAAVSQSEEARTDLKAVLEVVDIFRRDVIRPSLADAYSRKRQYMNVALNILKISGKKGKPLVRREVSKFVVQPFAYSKQKFEVALEAFSQYSLLDALLYAAAHFNIDRLPPSVSHLEVVWNGLDVDLRKALVFPSLDCAKVLDIYSRDDDDGEEDDISLYRHLSAFIECAGVLEFRALADYYLIMSPEERRADQYILELSAQRFSGDVDWCTLVTRSEGFSADLYSHQASSSGVLQRSLAMSVFFSKDFDCEQIGTDDFIWLMNNTTFADRVLSEKVLIELKELGRRRGDQLMRFIPLCLLTVRSDNSKHEFETRRVLQDLVVSDYNSDIVAFISDIISRAKQVGTYLYVILTEDFLLQLYLIHSTSSDAVECRARLHELMHELEGDKAYKDRADSLRLTAKIVNARSELNDSRIYVDLTRFGTWLRDGKLNSVMDLLRPGSFTSEDIERLTVREINTSQANEAQMLLHLSDMYREFCENRIFGIASYLGRRIRHGTLKGTLLQDTDKEMCERFPDLREDGPSAQFWSDWKAEFDSYIKKISADYFFVRSQHKPKGMISPDVSEGRKFNHLKHGAIALLSAYEKYEDPDYFVSLISELCWQICSIDLSMAQINISALRVSFRASKPPEGTRLHSYEADYRRHLNTTLDEKFNIVSSWFDRPKIAVPSVDLGTLLRVVHAEVSEEFSAYEGAQGENGFESILVTGARYHIVYDFLYVVLKNAAEHGRPKGYVGVDVVPVYDGDRIKELKFTIKSQYAPNDCAQAAIRRVEACQLDSLETAYIEEGKSGLRKIKRLERDWVDIRSVTIDPREDYFVVEMVLEFSI